MTATAGTRSLTAATSHVLITGASSGIGAALANCYAREGARLSLFGRDSGRLESIARECRGAGADVCTRIVDVADTEAMCNALQECDDRQPVDIVIANAGIGGEKVIVPPPGESLSAAREIIDTNVMGIANSVIPLLPRFVARGKGHIAIMSSLAAHVGLPDAPLYSASKSAARIYSHGLRRLLARSGVRVTAVCPGFVATPMSASVPGHRPFLWSPEKAAAHIAAGLARGKREISFPWQLAVLARLAGMLPDSLIDPILDRTRKGSA